MRGAAGVRRGPGGTLECLQWTQKPGPGNGWALAIPIPGSWVVPRYTTLQVPTHRTTPGTPLPRWRRCTHHDEHAGTCSNSSFRLDQGDPRGRKRTGPAAWLCRHWRHLTPCCSWALPWRLLKLFLSISQLYLSISQYNSGMDLRYISGISQV